MLFTVVLCPSDGAQNVVINILRPVLAGTALSELNLGAFFTGSRYSEILIFLVFSFFLTKNVNINKTFTRALVIFGIFFAMILIPTILVLGVDLAKMEFNPYFIYTRQVNAYDFIKRVQSINTLAWFPGMLLKLITYCFMASYTLSGVFKTKSHKGFVPLVTGLAFSIGMIPMMQKSSVVMLLASDKVFPYIILPFNFVIPILLLIVYFARRKKINEALAQKKSDASLSEAGGSINSS